MTEVHSVSELQTLFCVLHVLMKKGTTLMKHMLHSLDSQMLLVMFCVKKIPACCCSEEFLKGPILRKMYFSIAF